MESENENRKFDITRRTTGVLFRHYQLMVKLMGDEKTEHHNLEIFTTGPHQLLEMRRIYSGIYKTLNYKTIHNCIRNN